MHKPNKPSAPIKRALFTLYDSATLNEIQKKIDIEYDKGLISREAADEAIITLDRGCYGDDDKIEIRAVYMLDEESYIKNLVKYETKKTEYDSWYEQNKDAINEKSRIEASISRAKEIDDLETKLAKLKKRNHGK